MNKELKKAIVLWLFDNEDTWQRVNACHKQFKNYIYNEEGNYLIGGDTVSDFISDINKIIYSK